MTAAILPGDEQIHRTALDLASAYKPLTEVERKELFRSADSIRPIFKT